MIKSGFYTKIKKLKLVKIPRSITKVHIEQNFEKKSKKCEKVSNPRDTYPLRTALLQL